MKRLVITLLSFLFVPFLFAAPRSFTVAVEGKGQPVILIPGLSSPGSVWSSTVEHLKNDYTCHTLTLAGFAGTKPIDGPLLETVTSELALYVREQKLERPIVIGHSLGGFIAFALAARHPALVGPIVAVDGLPYAAELMASGASPEQIAKQAEAMSAFIASQNAEQFAMQTRMSMAAMITRPGDLERVAADAVRSDPATVGRAMKEMLTTDLRKEIGNIKSPVLLIAAAGRDLDETSLRELAGKYQAQVASIPRHEVVVANKAKHFVMLDDPAFFFATLDKFLKTAPARENGRSSR